MPLKVRRHKRRKTISHTNKKRLRRKMTKIPNVKSTLLAKAWDDQKSVKKNLHDMGLSYNPNVTVRNAIKHIKTPNLKLPKAEVAVTLEKEAKAPREVKFKFPHAQAIYFTYLIRKYGENYKEMARDPKNVYQETWKRIRSRILQFKKLEQYKQFFNIKNK